MLVDLKELSTPQLFAIKSIIKNGSVATAEVLPNEAVKGNSAQEEVCHKSPPKGYPTDKDQYADPACWRYPLNSKARCLAAWRYVHQERNKKVLGDKFSSIASKIKSYAKKHYSLDLQEGASANIDWFEIFTEYYESETAGDGFMENTENTQSVEAMTLELTNVKAELSAIKTKCEVLDKELADIKTERDTLLKFKEEKEKEEIKTKLVASRKALIEEAGLGLDVTSEIDKWLTLSDEQFKFTIDKLSEIKKSASASQTMKVPVITGVETKPVNHMAVVKEGFAKLKEKK